MKDRFNGIDNTSAGAYAEVNQGLRKQNELYILFNQFPAEEDLFQEIPPLIELKEIDFQDSIDIQSKIISERYSLLEAPAIVDLFDNIESLLNAGNLTSGATAYLRYLVEREFVFGRGFDPGRIFLAQVGLVQPETEQLELSPSYLGIFTDPKTERGEASLRRMEEVGRADMYGLRANLMMNAVSLSARGDTLSAEYLGYQQTYLGEISALWESELTDRYEFGENTT